MHVPRKNWEECGESGSGQKGGQEGSEAKKRRTEDHLAQPEGNSGDSVGHPQGVPIRSKGPGCFYHDTCQSLLPLRGHGCPGTSSPPGHRQGELQQPEEDPGAGSWERKYFGGPYAQKYGAQREHGRGLTALAKAPILTDVTVALLNPALVSPSSAQSSSQPYQPQGKSSLLSQPHRPPQTRSPQLPPCFTVSLTG